jgi:hypothetical protein
MRAMAAGRAWHGITPGSQSLSPRATWTPEERLADMDAQTVAAIYRECNDEVHQ